jgi:hypothetical protein
MVRQVGGKSRGKGSSPSESGCFGKAQAQVAGGPETLADDLDEMQQRVDADSRLIDANRKWAACMVDSGYSQFELPKDAMRYVMNKMDGLMGATPQEDGSTSFAIGGDDIDQAALAALRQEEITIAVADGTCSDQTGWDKTERKVQEEAQQRFLDEHPDLTSGS